MGESPKDVAPWRVERQTGETIGLQRRASAPLRILACVFFCHNRVLEGYNEAS